VAFTTAVLNLAVDAVATAGTWISAHTADPGTTGTSEVTGGAYARQQTTWGTASGGSRVGSQVTIPIPTGTTVTHIGIWSASTAGTFREGASITSQAFPSGGNLLHTATLTAA
jgi:hypothetical protein